MPRYTAFRLFCTIFLVISASAFPLFFTAGIGLFSIVWFKNYYEIIPIAFLSDVLFGVPLAHFFYFRYVFTLAAAVLVAITVFIRRHTFDGDNGGPSSTLRI